MTTRHAGYLVTLEKDMREDDAEGVITALRMVKGVVSVEPVIGDPSLALAEERARFRLQKALWDVVNKSRD